MPTAALTRLARSRARAVVLAISIPSALLMSAQAHAALTKARTFLESLEDNIEILIPIVAIIALALLGILYAADMIRKDTLFQWFFGIVIAGSAAELVALIF